MMIVEMLVVLMLIGFMTVGIDTHSIWQWIGLAVAAAAAALAVHFGLAWLLDHLLPNGYSQKTFFLPNRRRMTHGQCLRTPEEERLEALSDEALEQYLERKPKDALAVEIHCERLKEAERWPDYARELEYLLTIKNELSVEERCTRHHELAELFLKLGRPARAREALQALITAHPRHYQATLARRRLRQLDGNAQPGPPRREDFDVSRLGRH
jgi:hypothetical protein